MKKLTNKSKQNQTLLDFLRPASKQSGSLRKVREFVDEYQFMSNWNDIEHDGWRLIATSKKHYWCGLWQTFGCLNHKEHQRLGKGNRVYVKQYQRSCYRPLCKECYPKWIVRQANVSTRRIEKFQEKSKRKSIHLLLSVNSNQYFLSFKEMKKIVRKILQIISFSGEAIIFHPFRFNKKTRLWYYAPHFHVVGFGYRILIHKGYGKFGWLVKDLDERKSVFQTFCYLLSHCGVKEKIHTVSWGGSLSYSKLKIEKEPRITKCPVCGGEFVPIYYDGIHPVVPPERHFEGLVDYDGAWYSVETEPEQMPTDFEYASTRDLNEILKGMTLAV